MVVLSGGALLLQLAAPLGSALIGNRLIEFYHRAGAARPNYRGRPVPAVLGPAILLAYLPGAAAALWLGGGAPSFALLFLLLGFAFLGLWDDLVVERTSGFRGHFRAAWQGRITAGLLKTVLALLVGLIFCSRLPFSPWRRLAALLLLLLSANGLNLFDRRPGRALKVFFPGALLIIFLSPFPQPAARLLLPLLTGALAAAPLDLGGRGMLGDCGANLLGVSLGAAAALYLPPPLQLALLIFWSAIHLLSEFHSLSALIGRSRVLRLLDGLGRFRESPI